MRQQVHSIIDRREIAPERMADLSILRTEVIRSLKFLTNSERVVLQLRFGLAPYGVSCTLEEAGRVLKCTRERIRGIECKAITKLRHPRRCHNLIGYIDGVSEYPLIEG